MFRRALFAVACCLVATPAFALQTVTSLGCYGITSFSAAAPLPTVPTGGLAIEITVSGDPVNYRDDGTAPTATTTGGVLLPLGTSYYAGSLSKFQVIPISGAATAFYCVYK